MSSKAHLPLPAPPQRQSHSTSQNGRYSNIATGQQSSDRPPSPPPRKTDAKEAARERPNENNRKTVSEEVQQDASSVEDNIKVHNDSCFAEIDPVAHSKRMREDKQKCSIM